ncbi:MAG: 1-(5-phosphoribosyl)-5-[(5-phosphoribosylamino)methylideneamino] imidazole-4-carboxamide isomerase [Chloroflexi bacterium]|nr:1-(5-phosphoribosyl)-5-[(5-phosphoribosylamino)methylideneamino] imidazole-4-carboxamide isomerase [Chloroflexota bacterium]
MFVLYPAIDLRRGRVVRLQQGDPARETAYSSDPESVARRWLTQGAPWLHVVNLDAAFGEDDAANRAAIQGILARAHEAGARVQLGGGIRSPQSAATWLKAGVDRVILGSLAAREPETVGALARTWGTARVAAGLDAREGYVRIHGWQRGTSWPVPDLARTLYEAGVRVFIITDVARDGMGVGPNIELALAAREALPGPAQIIVSGGVRTLDHVREVQRAGLDGVIVGQALYAGSLSLKQALTALQEGANEAPSSRP